ncbi:MAG TPA: hypothetical protein VLX92_20820 [Kofleriaceae bacterium]|nr:hypothetical protein [Kofleriaceae bacterium]
MIAGCGSPLKPPSAPPAEPEPIAKPRLTPQKAGPAGREIVVGEMCPQGAGGRPAVAPLIMRGVQWTDSVAEVSATVERGGVPRFGVFGTDGKLAGAFDTLGMVDVGINVPVASGTYVGAPPCTYEVAAKPAAGQLATRAEDPKCAPATGGCGLAVGELEHPDEPPDVPQFQVGGACLSGDSLAVDIDNDGRPESFPLHDVLDGIRGPAQEWPAAPTAAATCTPHFQLYDIKLAPEPDPGKPVDAKAVVMMDVLGVVDLDGDGRREVVLALRFPTVRSVVVYSSIDSPERLELVGEATSFPR